MSTRDTAAEGKQRCDDNVEMRVTTTWRRCRLAALTVAVISAVFLFWVATEYVSDDGFYSDIAPNPVKEDWNSSARNCRTARESIFFLKTHKCGSSTVQNILLRYGERRQLAFFLPTRGNYLGSRVPFHRAMVLHSPWTILKPKIFCHHTIFNYNEVSAVMPVDTVYISMVREPAELFESLYSYASLHHHYKMTFKEFAAQDLSEKVYANRSGGNLGPNQMLFDFGFPTALMGFRSPKTEECVKEHLKELDKVFGLVMVAERFDESMILMRDFLCWDTRDMVYFSHNVRRSQAKTPMSKKVRAKMEELNWADKVLYDHFKDKFQRLVEGYGEERMKEEVRKLHSLREEIYGMCVQREGSGKDLTPRFRTYSDKVQGFQLRRSVENNKTCEALAMSEMAFTDRLRVNQLGRAFRLSPSEAAAKWMKLFPNFQIQSSHRIL